MAPPDASLLIGLLVLALGVVSVLAVLLMNRIDEHSIIERHCTLDNQHVACQRIDEAMHLGDATRPEAAQVVLEGRCLCR
jgi:hypothetical protein